MKNRSKLLIVGMLGLMFAIASVLVLGPAQAATTLTSRVEITIGGKLVNALDLVTATAPLEQTLTVSLANGTGADQADMVWSDTRTLATGATEDLDLAGGGLVDAFGVAFEPARVKFIYIYSDPDNTTNLTLLGDAAGVPILDDPSDTGTLAPGALFLKGGPGVTGYAVTATTGDIIQIANSAGASADYNIVIIGASS